MDAAGGVLLPENLDHKEFKAGETIIAPESKSEMASLPVTKQSKIAHKIKLMKNVAKVFRKKCIQLVKNLSIARKGSFDLNDDQENFTSISYNLSLTINDQSVTI